jgi:hypothetical protein
MRQFNRLDAAVTPSFLDQVGRLAHAGDALVDPATGCRWYPHAYGGVWMVRLGMADGAHMFHPHTHGQLSRATSRADGAFVVNGAAYELRAMVNGTAISVRVT